MTTGSRFGSGLEAIAPFHPAIRAKLGNPRDVRHLGSPLDFIVFNGLTRGRVESLLFAELKTGEDPKLSDAERRIRSVVLDKQVRFKSLDLGQSSCRPEEAP